MTILEMCGRLIELNHIIKSNEQEMILAKANNKKDLYEKLFAETVNFIDESTFYLNQLNEIESKVEIKVY